MRRGVWVLALGFAACRFDPAYRDQPDLDSIAHPCTDNILGCRGSILSRCENGAFTALDDCGARGLACATTLLKCTPCNPTELTCDGANVLACDSTGQTRAVVETCDGAKGFSCRNGGCTDLCGEAAIHRSNVGCEYWPVDLDNADLPPEQGLPGNAAIQQYAVIVTNPQPDVAATVTVEEDTSALGGPNTPKIVSTATLGPGHLEVFKLGPREVDGSPPDVPNGGTGTALTRNAYRLRSTVPIIAYQFNPLENVNVRSNDATILLPTPALSGTNVHYVVASWAQTIAKTDDPNTNFNQTLRAFLTVVGTTASTKVKIHTTARIVPGGPLGTGLAAGQDFETTLQPFEVLNLETGDFHADFTGSTVESNQPVVVYTGSEASDAPIWNTLADRSCCADHLEVQMMPTRAVGTHYAIGRMPNRSKAISAAGGVIGTFNEPELYRVVATAPAHVTTTLPAPYDSFDLPAVGANVILTVFQDFSLDATAPVMVADVQVSQEGAGVSIDNGLPGGDPNLVLLPPIEQWRSSYVMLTPDKYAFDFLVVAAPVKAQVFVDGLQADTTRCAITSELAGYLFYRCQLSFPIIDPSARPPNNVLPGVQNDGVHRVQSDMPVGVVVYGFDYRVSYAYVGGTELTDIAPQ